MLRLVLWIFILALPQMGLADRVVMVEDGRVDLRAWDPSSDELVSLKGRWEFYHQRFLTSDDFKKGQQPKPILVDINTSWSRLGHAKSQMYDYGTFRMVAKLKQGAHRLAILSSIFWSSSKVFVNGELVSEKGQVASDRESYQFSNQRGTDEFVVSGEHLEIMVQVANFDMYVMGNNGPLYLGSPQAVRQSREPLKAEGLIIFGALIIMGLYNYFLFTLNRHDRPALWFGACCLGISIYALISGDDVVTVFFPDMTSRTKVILFNLGWYLGASAFMNYAWHVYPQYIPRWFRNCFLTVGVILSVHIIFGPLQRSLLLAMIMQLTVVVSIFYIVRACIRSISGGDRKSWLFLAAFIISAVGSVNDMLYISMIVETGFLASKSLFVFVLFHSLLVSIRHVQTYNEASEKKLIEQHLNEAQTLFGIQSIRETKIPGVSWAAHYQPAEVASGDWFGLWHDPDMHRVYAMVGDVSGHGMKPSLMTVAAAGAMNATRSTLTMNGANQVGLLEALESLSSAMNSALLGPAKLFDLHMTMAFVSVDLNSGQACYLNAGHVPVFIASQGKVRTLLRPGTPLGSKEDPKFGAQEFELAYDECLVLYTDGLTENEGPEGDTLNLRRTLKKHGRIQDPLALRDSLLEAGRAVWQGAEGQDDCVIMTLSRDADKAAS